MSNSIYYYMENIPERYSNAKFEAKTESQEVFIKKMIENIEGKELKDIRDFVLTGAIGTGKTHIMLGLLNKLIEFKRRCKYATERELVELYHTKNFDKYNSFKTPEFLVIDELGKE